MARQVWATLQTNSKAKLNEKNYLFNFDPASSLAASPEEYKRRAIAAWTGASGGLSKGEQGDGKTD